MTTADTNHSEASPKPEGGNRMLKIMQWLMSALCLVLSFLLPTYLAVPEGFGPDTVQEFARSFRILAVAAFFLGFMF